MTARAGVIKEAGDSILTPTRVLSSKELDNGEKIQGSNLANPVFPHKIFEVTRQLMPWTVDGFVSNGEASLGLQKQIEKISRSAGTRLTLFHPVLDRRLDIQDRVNDVFVEIQLQSDIDAIAVLDRFNSKPALFEERLVRSMGHIEKAGSASEPMPVLRMDMDDRLFEPKLKAILKHNVKVINLTYASVLLNFQNYVTLMKVMKDKNVWIHMSELRKTFLRKAALPHIMPLFNIDSYALASKRFPIGKVEIKLRTLKRFDAGTLGHLTPDEYREIYGEELNCRCFVDKGRDLSNFIDVFNGAELLTPALACHETTGSHQEFEKGRARIMHDEYRDYLRHKEHLIAPIKRLLKVDLNDRTLG